MERSTSWLAGLAAGSRAGVQWGMGIQVTVNQDGCEVDDLAFCGAVLVTVAARESWDEFVELAVRSEWVGVEALAGRAPTVGEAVRRSVRAFGQAVGDTVASVRTWDRATDAQRTFAAADCRFSADGSRFGELATDGSSRYHLLDVGFLLKQGDLTFPIADPALADRLGLVVGQRVPLARVWRVTHVAG